MKLSTVHQRATRRRGGFTLLEVLVVVAILVILAGVGVVATTRYLENARKSQAQLQCKGLAAACEAYYLDARSGGNYPETLNQLMEYPGLKNGQQDLVSPWNNIPYNLTVRDNADGSKTPVVWVQAPDGVSVSQFGIGPMSQMN